MTSLHRHYLNLRWRFLPHNIILRRKVEQRKRELRAAIAAAAERYRNGNPDSVDIDLD